MKLEYKIQNLTKYQTIKSILKEEFFMSERLISKLKNAKQIYVNNKPVYINYQFKSGDLLTVDLNFTENSDNIVPTQMNLSILFEDDSLLVVDKPAGIPVHPSMEHYVDSLSNGVKYYFNSINLNRKIRPVNRLDRNTSGIVIFAKNQYIQECLVKQMKNELFTKEYLAIVFGNFENDYQIVNAPIARKQNSIIERCVSNNRRECYYYYRTYKKNKKLFIIKMYIKNRSYTSNSCTYAIFRSPTTW